MKFFIEHLLSAWLWGDKPEQKRKTSASWNDNLVEKTIASTFLARTVTPTPF